MGIGSYLSRFIGTGLVARFIRIELMVGLVGGSSAAVLFIVFAYLESFRLILYAQVVIVGVLVGLEIPLLLRILKDKLQFKDLVSRKNRFSILLTVITLVLYYGFILLIAFNRDVFAFKVFGIVTFGILLGIGVILSCWVLTGIYVRWANQKYDAMVARLQEKAKHGS